MTVSVYVHFPFCLRKCPYCDFSSVAINQTLIPHRQYADAVLCELSWRASKLTGERLKSVFFGGGTPSLWDPSEVGRVLEGICARFQTTPTDIEATLECNPSSLNKNKAAHYRRIGVNRLSIGVQSLDDAHLRYLNRLHTSRESVQAIEIALSEISRVSVDMIFGLPDQTPDDFCDELKRIDKLGIRHISAYALTIEPSTRFGELYPRGQLKTASDDDSAACFLAARQTLEEMGFEQYEVSNYAKPGQEAKHNQHYWRGGAYLGLGAAAVGCLHGGIGNARRYRNDGDFERYIARSGSAEVEAFEEQLGPNEIINEALMLGLRTKQGVHLPTVQARAGKSAVEAGKNDWRILFERGDLILDGDWLKAPMARWLHLDSIVANAFLNNT